MKIDSPNATGITTGFGVPTGGTSGQVLQKTNNTNYGTQWVNPYVNGRYAHWAPWMSADPSGMGATFTAPNGINGGENGWQLTTTASAGQNARIHWTSTDIDWTKDFKIEVVYYCGKWNDLNDTGDGFCLYVGTTGSPSTYANEADGALKFRLFTYNGNVAPNQGGASFYIGSTKGPQGTIGNSWSIDVWLRFTVEVCRDKVTNKRMAVAYITKDAVAGYTGKAHIAAMDVTSWVPSGGNFGFFTSTGGARANQYVNSIKFEAL